MDKKDHEKGRLASDEIEFLKAGKVVDSLIKTLKNIMIYPEDNPIPAEQKRRFFEKFSEFLDDYGELSLEVRYAQLHYKGHMIYQDYNEKEGLAHSMHQAGISAITFKEGLILNELSDLLNVLRDGFALNSLEDDLVTLLWEYDFDHISYKVIDEFLEEEPDIPLLDHRVSDFKKLDDASSVYYSEVNLPGEKRGEEQEAEQIKVQKSFQNAKVFVEEDVLKIDQLLKKDESYQGMEEVLSVVEEVFSADQELPEFNDAVKVVEKSLDRLLESGEFKSSFRIVQLMHELAEGYKEKFPKRSARLAETVNRAGDSERIKLITSVLNKEENPSLKWAKAYLSSLHWNSIFNILNMLGELNTYPARKLVCDVLAGFGTEHFDMVARGISDHRWYVVRNVVAILGRIGDPRAIPHLKETIKCDELQVRRETIRALELIGGPDAARVLLSAVDDPSPRLRAKTFSLLGKLGEKIATEPLLQITKSRGFKEKSEEEKKAVLFSLAAIGKDEVVETLKKTAKKRSWFGREKDQETKIATIKALGSINTMLAQRALEELCQKGKKQLREISKRTLERRNRETAKQDAAS